MLARIRAALAAKAKNEQGFTLIELLVVVLIIGILAAIAIPVYIGQQNAAHDAAAESNLTNAKLAITAYYAATGEISTDPTALADYGWPTSDQPLTVGAFTDLADLTISTCSESGTTYTITAATGPTAGADCTPV